MKRSEFFTVLEKLEACAPGVKLAKRTPGRVSMIAARWAKYHKKNESDVWIKQHRAGEFFGWLQSFASVSDYQLERYFKLTPKECGQLRKVISAAEKAAGIE